MPSPRPRRWDLTPTAAPLDARPWEAINLISDQVVSRLRRDQTTRSLRLLGRWIRTTDYLIQSQVTKIPPVAHDVPAQIQRNAGSGAASMQRISELPEKGNPVTS